MNYSALLFDNSRLTTLLILLLIVTGLGSLLTNTRQEDPNLTERFGFITIHWPGASSERVENLITKILEANLDIEEIKEITSNSRQNRVTFNLELYDWIDQEKSESVWSLIRDQVADIALQFPAGVSKPQIEVNVISAHGIIIGLKNKLNPDNISILARYADYFSRQLSASDGTRSIDIIGYPQQHILISPDIAALTRLNLSLASLTQILASHNVRYPAGTVSSDWGNVEFEVFDATTTVNSVGNIPIVGAIRLADIAKIEKNTIQPSPKLAIHQGEQVVMVAIRPFYNQRVDNWTKRTLSTIDRLEAELPPTIDMEIIFNQSFYTEKRFDGLFQNLLLAVVLVFLLLCFTLGIRTALVISLTVPVILLGSVGLMGNSNLAFHQLSLTGLIISLGMMIDNPIVVSDHFSHLRNSGMKLRDAVIQTAKDLQGPLLASTLTTCFAFLPIATGDGNASEFVGGLALAVVFSVAMSFIVAIGFLPIILAWVDRFKFSKPWFTSGINLFFLHKSYRAFLRSCIKVPIKGILIGLVLPILGFISIPLAEVHFFPPVDRDMFQISVTFPNHYNTDQSSAEIEKLDSYLRQQAFIKQTSWTFAERSPRVFYNMLQTPSVSGNIAIGIIKTINKESTRELAPQLQVDLMAEFAGYLIRVQPFNQGPPSFAPIQVKIIGEDLDDLKIASRHIRSLLHQIPEVTFTSAELDSPTIIDSYKLNQNRMQQANLASSIVPQSIAAAYGQTSVDLLDENGKTIPVTIMLPKQLRQNRLAADSMPLLFGGENAISLSDVAETSVTSHPTSITHENSQRISIVNAFLIPYELAQTAEAKFLQLLDDSTEILPSSVTLKLGGESSDSDESLNSFLSDAVFFLLLIILAIVLFLNSYKLGALIIGIMILSFGLAMLGIFISGEPRGFTSIVGSLGLIGLAVNDSIIVLSALFRATAKSDYSLDNMVNAIFRATRHILSTTITTIGGFLPLILAGEKLWLGLSWAIVGGIAGASILSLTLVPAIFAFIHRHKISPAVTTNI